MKKLFLCILVTGLLCAGCTSKEQDEKIKNYWQQQMVSLFAKRMAMRPAAPIVPPSEQMPQAFAQGAQLPPQLQEHPQPGIAPESAVQKPAEGAAPNDKPAVDPQQTPQVTAFLFIHTQSPLCQQLKKDQWDEQFKQKYQGQVRLVEYDMINPSSKEPLRKQMYQHKLSSLSVPILFIGSAAIPGYPFEGVDEAVQKALTNPQPQTARKPRPKQPTQFMEIIMEDDPKNNPVNSKASARDSRAMQLALAGVERSNQAYLTDVGSLFGEDTKAQAFAVISRTERLLRKKAASSPDYQTYLATQKQLLELQEKELNQLMRQNARSLRKVRG